MKKEESKAREYVYKYVLYCRERENSLFTGNEWLNIISKLTNIDIDKIRTVYDECIQYSRDELDWYDLRNLTSSVIKKFEKVTFDQNFYDNIEDEFHRLYMKYQDLIYRNKRDMLAGSIYLKANTDVEMLELVDSLEFSLITENMIEYDSILFNSSMDVEHDEKNRLYKPYIVELEVDNVYTFLHGRLLDSQWIKVDLVTEIEKNYEGDYFEGDLLFSASPFERSHRVFRIVNEEVPEHIRNVERNYEVSSQYIYDKTREDELVDYFHRLLPTFTKKFNISIFNVGQGSFNYIEGARFKLLFDVGLSTRDGNTNENYLRNKALSDIKKIQSDVIVLSHWDLDHILGVTIINDTNFNNTWIVPSINDLRYVSLSAKRLCKYLEWKKDINLIAIDWSYNGEIIYQNEKFEIGKGKGKHNVMGKSPSGLDIRGLNENNNFGLCLKVKGMTEDILFTGDCEYDSLPDAFLRKLPSYVVAPHHGSKVVDWAWDKSDLSSVKTAFISSGANMYSCSHDLQKKCDKHPHWCHMNLLDRIGYRIMFTEIVPFYKFDVK